MNITIFGGSLASLTLADCLAQDQINFTWITLGEKIGGHFSGLQIQQDTHDIGMVLLEFVPGKNNPSKYSELEDEQEALGNFFRDIFLEEASVEVLSNKKLIPDFIISDNLDVIRLRKKNYFSNSNPIKHPRDKWLNSWFEEVNYESVCTELYPEFYSDYLKKIANKITSGSANKLSARYHRSAWLPLYYPESISGDNNSLSIYPFQKIKGSNLANFIIQKIQKIKQSPYAKIDERLHRNLSADHLLHDIGTQKFFGCDTLKLPGTKEYFDNSKYFQPKYNICVLELKHNIDLLPDSIFDLDDESIFRVTCSSGSYTGKQYLFFEANSVTKSCSEFVKYCSDYTIKNFGLDVAQSVMCKVDFGGPRFAKAGAEDNLFSLKAFVESNYASQNCHFYGMHNGINAMAMNKQIAHALNTWRTQI